MTRKLTLIAILIAVCVSTAFAEGNVKLAKYQLEVDRYGPVLIGMTPQEGSGKLGISLIPVEQPSKEELSCYYVYPDGKFDDMGFMVQDGRITRIDVYSKKVSSTGGIRIGDAEGAVKKAFPGKVKEEIHPYIGEEGKYLIVETKRGFAFIFETNNGKITSFRSGRLSPVKYIEGCL
jgi:hypothetical protein